MTKQKAKNYINKVRLYSESLYNILYVQDLAHFLRILFCILCTVHIIFYTLQRQFRLYIPFLGIARPQPQFLHSCVCERFIYSQDRSTYFLQQKRQLHHGNTLFANRHMNVEIGLRPRYSFSGNICFQFSEFFLSSAA